MTGSTLAFPVVALDALPAHAKTPFLLFVRKPLGSSSGMKKDITADRKAVLEANVPRYPRILNMNCVAS